MGPRERLFARPHRDSSASSVLVLVLLQALVGATNLGLRLFAANPVSALDALAGLEILVHLKEMLNLQAVIMITR